jgi:hypothetical protein
MPRDPRATTYLMGFVVSAVLTILILRLALALAGYPQVGGGGLHIAHELWGGLLMGLAIVLAMSFIGQVVRPYVAIVTGIGFGLFLDEVGKFVTSTNNYFFKPALAIIYATVVFFVLVVHWVHGRRPSSSPPRWRRCARPPVGDSATTAGNARCSWSGSVAISRARNRSGR